MEKIRIGVLMGGASVEREVSFNSGRTVCDHLDSYAYTIVPLYLTRTGVLFKLPWSFLHRGKTTDFEYRLADQADLVRWDDLSNMVDLIYIAMHGRLAEDGTLQGFLEVLGIPYVGSKHYASALGMDKWMQKKILTAHGITVPRAIFLSAYEIKNGVHEISLMEHLAREGIVFPCIVKPHKEGSSFGVAVVNNSKDLHEAVYKAAYCGGEYTQGVLIEQKIKGMEFTCIIVSSDNGWVPLSVTEVIPDAHLSYFDYEQKYMPGKSLQFTPARCDYAVQQIIQKICARVMDILEFKTIGRIDGILTPEGEIFIIDPNSFSGAGPASFLFKQGIQRHMNHTQLINYIINQELNQYGIASSSNVLENNGDASMSRKLRIGVLMGGNSHEREISLESGRNVVYKLSPHKYEAIPFFVTEKMELFSITPQQLVSSSTRELAETVLQEQKLGWSDLQKRVDFVFIALHGGAGENGQVQGALEMLNLPYNGSSVLTSALCMDKFKTTQFLKSEGFDVPASMLIAYDQWQRESSKIVEVAISTLSFPLIVKPHDDGCSVLVQKVIHTDDLITAVQKIFLQGKTHAMIEECMSGMELTVGVIGNELPTVLPASRAVVAGDILSIEEKFLPGAGENQTPAPLSKEAHAFVAQTIKRVYQAVGCSGYARIDCFYQDEYQSKTGAQRVVILEINTLPGLTPATCLFHQAAEIGMRPMELIDQIIMYGFQAHQSYKFFATQDNHAVLVESNQQ